MIVLGLKQLRLLRVGEESALHQDSGAGDIGHQIDIISCPFDLFSARAVDGAVQLVLDRLGQEFAIPDAVVEHLGPVDAGHGGQTVLVDADEDTSLHAVAECHTVAEIGVFLFTNGLAPLVVDGDVLPPGHHSVPPRQAGQVRNHQGHREVDPGLYGAVIGHGSPVLSSVAGVNDQNRQ